MKIEKLDNNGRGIVFVNNKITFVENALPNEDVDIKITLEKKKFNEAVVLNYNEKSIDRKDPICPYYSFCGGCDLMHLNYDKQLEFKLKKVNDLLNKFGGIDYNITKIIKTSELYYRNKATFQVKEKVGYYKEKSYDLISIEKCYIVDEKINEILKQVENLDLKDVYQVMIRASKNTDETMVVLKCNNEVDVSCLDVTTVVLYLNNEYKIVKGKGTILEQLDDLSFVISPDSFFQVNTKGAELLYKQVLDVANLTGQEKVLDLFCGTGTIGLFLSRYCESVIGVEINKFAVEDAIINKKLNHIRNIEFICDDASNVNFKDLDLVVVDPPRSGLDKKMINYLLSLNVKKIIYVSCDPVTLARDLNDLKEKYDIEDITLVDMFSQTHHVETVVSLIRK